MKSVVSRPSFSKIVLFSDNGFNIVQTFVNNSGEYGINFNCVK